MVALELLVGAILAPSAHAENATATSSLARFCKAQEQLDAPGSMGTEAGLRLLYDKAYCLGFITSWWETLNVLGPRGTACPPDAVTYEQLRLVFLKWAADNPQELHQDASIGLLMAASKAFPCPATKTKK